MQSENGYQKKDSHRKASSFVQNIHHFRDDALASQLAPIERVVVFDEAQRAWTQSQTSQFMKIKKGIDDFSMSEPEFLISVMNRHHGACTIICLVGGGQEINTGEAGIEEWVRALRGSYPEWKIYYSSKIVEDINYMRDSELIGWIQKAGISQDELHLSVSLRSFRSERLSDFVKCLLDLEADKASKLLLEITPFYPIVLTRDIDKARLWLKQQARGSERYGMVASSGAMRLIPHGINVKYSIDAANWFLNDKDDIRSSYFCEQVATEFDIQGLELDWTCVCWDGDLSFREGKWLFKKFSGTSWKIRNSQIHQEYLKNAYRVLLTRARQGMVIFVPNGNNDDGTREMDYYDGTYEYLISLGINEI